MMTSLAAVADAVIQASSDDDTSSLGLLFLAAGFVFYGFIFVKYRNTDKRHRFEAETKAAIDDVHGTDVFVRSNNHQRRSKMFGANNHAVRGMLKKR